MKDIAGKLLVSIVATIFTLVVIEVGFRALGVRQIVAKPRHDRPRAYFMPEDSTSLQDRGYPSKKSPGTFRISVVGDSFSFGPHMQYDDTFAKRLERLLNLNREQPRVEVINRGISGFSAKDEMPQVLQAAEAGSDLVILQITLNDPELDPLNLNDQAIENRYHFEKFKKPEGLLRNWKSLVFLLERMHNAATHENYKRYFHDLFFEDSSWRPFAGAVSRITKICKDRNVPLVAVLFPIFTFPIDRNYPFIDIHGKISQLFLEKGVPLLDLLDSYHGLSPERLQVWPGKDSHPGEVAHRIAAERLYLWLVKNHLVPETMLARHIYRRREHLRYPQMKPKQIARLLEKNG